MTHLSAADYVVIGEFAVALLGLFYFVIRYAISTEGEWSNSPEGRHLMFFRGSLAAFMVMAIVHSIWRDYPGRDAVRVVVVGTFALAVLHGDMLMERAQRARRRLLRLAARRDSEAGKQRRP